MAGSDISALANGLHLVVLRMLLLLAGIATLVMWWLSAAGVYDYPQFFALAPLLIWYVMGAQTSKGGGRRRRLFRRR